MPDEESSGDGSPFGEFDQEPVRGRDGPVSRPPKPRRFRINPVLAVVLLAAVVAIPVAAGGIQGGGDDSGGGSPNQEADPALDRAALAKECRQAAGPARPMCRLLRAEDAAAAQLAFADCRARRDPVAVCIIEAHSEDCIEAGLPRRQCLAVARNTPTAAAYADCRTTGGGPADCLRLVEATPLRACGKGPVVVRVNEFTSCGLARNVQRRLGVDSDRRISQLAGRPSRVTRVRSPVTGERYTLRCRAGLGGLLCTGANRIWIGFAVR